LLLSIIIWLLSPTLARFEDSLWSDQGPNWYYWKLPPYDPMYPGGPTYSLVAQIITWSMYAAHQILVWWLIYKTMHTVKTWINGVYKINLIMLFTNLGFVILHIIQTELLYDGLAADVPIWTSQGSVILLLSFMIIIENPRRGIIFGKKANFRQDIVSSLRKYHGYYFAWACVYTFWFHPTTQSWAHFFGFFYMFLLFLQTSLMYVKVHVNKWWTTFLESFVMIHGTLVALLTQSSPMWVMFFLGFLWMIVFTYAYGLGLPKWVNWVLIAVYIGICVFIYAPFGLGRQISYLYRMEMLWIPIILYLVAFVIYYIGILIAKIRQKSVKK
jgi:hypothetical protein